MSIVLHIYDSDNTSIGGSENMVLYNQSIQM